MAKNDQNPEQTPSAAPAAAAPAPAVVTKKEPVYGPNRPKSYPPSPLSGDKGIANLQRQWKRSKQTQCSEDKCYYPLKPFRHDGNNHEEKRITTEKGNFREGVCSWDPLHGTGELVRDSSHRDGYSRIQLIPIPDKKEVEG